MKRLTFKITLFVTVLAVLGASLSPMLGGKAQALSGVEFDPGRIIDNGVFENKNAMGIDQIQEFLNSKVPTCDIWGTQPYNGTTRRAYSESRGVTFPLTCLKDYHENTTTKENNLEGRAIPAGAKSAARIIFDAGQQYNINPQVLIVLLQKEQALITDDWAWPIQFTKATGYGCPDTAPCAAEYAGFYNQVNNAAKQFRRYADSPNSYNHIPNQNNSVRWNPNASCGTSNVYIANQATASLYNYTPYRPNQAALNNLYGTGDSCSAYGNRNFWRYFRDWFGTTYADPFMWQVTDMFIMDEGKNAIVPTDYLRKGERLFVVVKGKNLGTETWFRDGVNPARLGSWSPRDHASKYCDVLWLSLSSFCNRSARLVEETVPSGGTFHYEMYIHAPNDGGEFREYFRPLLEGRAWMTNETGFHIYINSTNFYDWRWLFFDAYTDSSKTTRVSMDNVARGQEIYIELKVKNSSATTWVNSGPNATRLGTQVPQDHNSFLCMPSWVACNRPANITEATVIPGQNATFGFTIKAPSTIGVYREYVKPVRELKGWMRDDPNHIYLNVTH